MKKDELEYKFELFLSKIIVPKSMLRLVDKIFNNTMENSASVINLLRENKKEEITKMKIRKNEIELVMEKTKNIKLHSKYEKEWVCLDDKIEILKEEIKEKELSKIKMKHLLDKTKILFENPIDLWTL